MLSFTLWGTDMTYFYTIYFVALASYLELVRRLLQFRPFSKRELAGLFAVGIALRLMFLPIAPSLSVDVVTYFNQVKSGTGFAPNVGNFFSFPPAFWYLLKLLSFFQIGPLTFRGLMIVADILTAYLIKRLMMNLWHADKAANVAAVAYLFFPPAIIESGWNGHFEPLVNSVALIALILSTQQKSIRAGIGSAVAIALKAYPALFAIGDLALLSRRGWKSFTLSLFLTLSFMIVPVVYYGGVRSVAINVLLVAFTATGFGPAGVLSPLNYIGGIFQYLAGSSIALVQYLQFISAGVVGIALLITLNMRRYHRWIVLMFLIWLGALAELYGFVRFAESYNIASNLLAYWFVPPALNFSLAALFVVAGALLIVAAYRIWIENSRMRLLFIGLSLAGAIMIMNFSYLEGWFIFFFVPLAFLLIPRRYVLPLLLFALILYSAPYTSSNFQSIGAVANTVSILPTTLRYTAINHLGPDVSANGPDISWTNASVSANQGEIESAGEMACFMTNTPYTYSFYSVNVNVNQSQFPFMLVNGNSSLTSLRFEFWNNGNGIAYWVPESLEDTQYVDTTALTGNVGFNRVVIVNLKPHGQRQCLDDLRFLPPGSEGAVTAFTRGTSLGLEFKSQNATELGASNGYAGLLMNVTHPIGEWNILTLDLETNYSSGLEIGVIYKDRQHNADMFYSASRGGEELIDFNFSFTPYSMSLWEIRNTEMLGIIIRAYSLNFPNSMHSVLVNLLQFSDYVQRPNIVTLIGVSASLCAAFTVDASMFPKKPRRSISS